MNNTVYSEQNFRKLIDEHIGYHTPSKDSLEETCSKLPNLPIQIFLHSPTKLTAKIDPKDVQNASKLIKKRNETAKNSTKSMTFIHSSYIANLANTGNYATNCVIKHMQIGETLRITGVVIHTAKYKNVGFDQGFMNFVENIGKILDDKNYKTKNPPTLLIETCISAGTEMFGKQEDLISFMELMREEHGEKIGICVDTAHVWGAGYNPSEFIEKFEKKLPGCIKLIHFNGSSKKFGSKTDGHCDPFSGNIDPKDMFKVAQWGLKNNVPLIREHEVTINLNSFKIHLKHYCNHSHDHHNNPSTGTINSSFVEHNEILDEQDQEELLAIFEPKVVPEINLKLGQMLKQVSNIRATNGVPQRGRNWSAIKHKQAAEIIMKHTTPITSYEQALKLDNVGKGIALKIKEFLETGELKEFLKLNKVEIEKQKALEIFTDIWGVGLATAQIWFKDGMKTLEDVRQNDKLHLTKQQQLGLTYYEDMKIPMARNEIEHIGDILTDAMNEVSFDMELHIVGSFRREQNPNHTSKDIDVLITCDHNPSKDNQNVLVGMIDKLSESMGVEIYSLGESSFIGLIEIDGIYRHVDIWIATGDEIYFAKVAHTNSKSMNINIRKLAAKKGLKLNEKGLFDGRGKLIKVKSEREIFDKFGIEPEYKC